MKRGFTLLEMLVATLIMGIAVVGLLGGLSGATRNAARLMDHDRAVQLARIKMNDLIAARQLPLNRELDGAFDPREAGGLEAGWRARVSVFAKPPAITGYLLMDRVELEVWWKRGNDRRSFALEGYRTRTTDPRDYAAEAAPMKTGSERGVTLMEVLIAITLMALLSAGMLTAMRVGIAALAKTDAKLMENRRVAGAQRIIEQEIEGFMPSPAMCGVESPVPSAGLRIPLFQGEPQAMRFASTFSLEQGWRGQPQILEFTVIPGEDGRGYRLIVNEIPYSLFSANRLCIGQMVEPVEKAVYPKFLPIVPGPRSFVLADKLEYCRFLYLEPAAPPLVPNDKWRPLWLLPRWPQAIRIEMAALQLDPSRLQPISITVPLHIQRAMDIQYVD